ncbi:MAG: alpha/beta hydrolase [Actinomycetota bacterium]|nr:alpha/beta hydrolase [Actinomycetota bacterium]
MTAVLTVAAASQLLRGGGPSGPTDEDRTGAPVERNIQISGAGRRPIAGTLRVPEQTGQAQVPGVLIISGFGPTNRNGIVRPGGQTDPLYRDLSDVLADAGMASLRYDKRGTGQSALPAGETLALADMAADARSGIDFLAARREIDAGALSVIGHGEGALLAMRVAASDPRVRSLVLISSPGRPLVEVIADDFRTTHGELSAERLRGIVHGMMATGTLPAPESLPREYQEFFPRDQIPYLREIFSIDPPSYARELDVPVLIVRGGRATFSTAVDVGPLVEALDAKAEVLVAPEAGATLARAPAAHGGGGIVHGGHEVGDDNDNGTRTTSRDRDRVALGRISSWLAARLTAEH